MSPLLRLALGGGVDRDQADLRVVNMTISSFVLKKPLSGTYFPLASESILRNKFCCVGV